ncbi:MAG: AbrB/MazE/SpoVT family DNA-binding domain-containing protein [Campylobacterota bacterium]|nr:AbrB/MazE/SpoVT family DNA-binding domain-containing protein [Campylobacterota bacterium]
MTATISSWGNSQGLRFPKDIMKELHLSIGDKMKVLIENQKIVLEPIKQSREKYDINDLVNKLPKVANNDCEANFPRKNYKAYEEFDNKVGLEEW